MSNQNKITILHQNLQHSKNATTALLINAKELDATFLCLQEPYTYDDAFGGLKNHYNILNRPNPKCAIAMCKSQPIAILISQFSNSSCTCVEVRSSNPFILCSVYFSRGTGVLEDELKNLQKIITKYSRQPIIITGDFNGWHPSWGSVSTDPRGQTIYEFFFRNQMFSRNQGSTTTFASHAGQSHIDVTFANIKALRYLCNWRVDTERASLSDHRLLSFQWLSTKETLPISLTRKFHTNNINWRKFDGHTKRSIQYYDNNVANINSKQETLQFGDSLTKAIVKVGEKSLPPSKPPKREIDFLTPELKTMRDVVNNLQRMWSRHRTDSLMEPYHRNRYLSVKYPYEKLLETAKQEAFRKFYSVQNSETVWNQVYKW